MKRTIVSLGSVVVLGVAMAAAQNTQPPAGTQTGNVSGHTATTETQNNTAGSISGNAGTAAKPAGQNPTQDPTKPTLENTTPAATGAQQNTQAPATGSAQTTSGDAAQSSTFGNDTATLKGQLDSAFQSEPTLSGSNIEVNVTDSTVELTGSVPTGKEKTTAKRIAQSYAGNRKVIDRLTATGRGSAPASPTQMQQQQQTPPPQTNKPQGDANPTVPQKK